MTIERLVIVELGVGNRVRKREWRKAGGLSGVCRLLESSRNLTMNTGVRLRYYRLS